MTDVDVAGDRILENGGTGSAGQKVMYIDGAAKAAQNDTLTITNANTVLLAILQIDATGAAEPNTKSTNVITLTSATTGTVSGIVYYK